MDEPQVRIDMADVAAYIKMNHPEVWVKAVTAVQANTRDIMNRVTNGAT